MSGADGLTRARPALQRLVDGVRARSDGARLGLVVVDVATGERLAWNGAERFTAASVIKVPVLLAALRQVDDGVLGLDERIARPARNAVGGSGVLKELTSVDEMSLRDLLTLMIVISDNTATNTVLDVIGVAAVGELLRDLGGTASRIERKLMDLAARERGLDNVLTADDVATVLVQLERGEVLTAEGTRTALEILGRQQLRDRLPRYLPDDVQVAHKTGELSGVRHDAGVLYLGADGSRPVVVVVLTEGFTDTLSVGVGTGGDANDLGADIGHAVYEAYLA